MQHCLPIDSTLAYGPYPAGFTLRYCISVSGISQTQWLRRRASFNPPSCIIGQIYYDGGGGAASGGTGLSAGVSVDNVGGTFPAPIPQIRKPSEVYPDRLRPPLVPGVGITPGGIAYTIPCHHGPILDNVRELFVIRLPLVQPALAPYRRPGWAGWRGIQTRATC